VICLQKLAVFALDPIDVLGRQSACDIETTGRDELDGDRTDLGPIGTAREKKSKRSKFLLMHNTAERIYNSSKTAQMTNIG
jgi:hypothetical protein